MGGLQVLSYILDAKNPPLSEGGAEVIVDTKAKDSKAYRIRFFKGDDLRLRFLAEESDKKEEGTVISLRWQGKKTKTS